MTTFCKILRCCLLAMAATLVHAADRPRAVGVGQPAPDVTFQDLGGQRHAMPAMKGSVVVINFWMIACTPCIEEIPKLNRLVERYKNDNVRFIALAGEGAAQLSPFLATHPFAYHIIPDAFAMMTTHFFVHAWPMHLVIDQEGIVRRVVVGALADIDQQLDQTISTLLDKTPGQDRGG